MERILKIVSAKHGEHICHYDECDYLMVSQFRWAINKRGRVYYAVARKQVNNVIVDIKMHRLIAGATDSSIKVDHIDHDGLNNCRCNLRLATNIENIRNSRPSKNNIVGYKGVGFMPKVSKYRARIRINRKEKHLGMFDSANEAAMAYNNAAKLNFGEFAYLNVIDELRTDGLIKSRQPNIRRDNNTGYLGVCFRKITGTYVARIRYNKKEYYIGGAYKTPYEAAVAYNNKAIELYGNGAIINKL